MEVLCFGKFTEKFLKIQLGAGCDEDFEHYCIFNVFTADELGIDGELELTCGDGGMLALPREPGNAAELRDMAIKQGVIEMAFNNDETTLTTLILRD